MVRKICETCKGKGWIRNPKITVPQAYYNPATGSSWPEMNCPNCNGAGFVGKPEVGNG